MLRSLFRVLPFPAHREGMDGKIDSAVSGPSRSGPMELLAAMFGGERLG